MRTLFVLLTILAITSGGALGAAADEQYTDEELGIQPGQHRPLTSIEAWTNLPKGNANSMGLSAEYSTRMGYTEQAIKQSKKALDRDPDDLDLHQTYAEALENKIKTQDERDPYLFNECVREWLIVLRNEVGDESGMTWHGLSIPAMQTLYRDSARGAVAKRHLEELTGSLPKSWETNARYMKRISKDADSKVAGKVMMKPKAGSAPAAEDKDDDVAPVRKSAAPAAVAPAAQTRAATPAASIPAAPTPAASIPAASTPAASIPAASTRAAATSGAPTPGAQIRDTRMIARPEAQDKITH